MVVFFLATLSLLPYDTHFCLATLVFSSRRSLLPLAFALRSSSLALVESYRTIIEQRTKGEKTRSQTLITASYLLFVDFHIDCQPPRWSSLVTFDGQRLPRWSSSSRFVVDCQPLDLPHQLLTSRDFLFAILLSTASFPLDLPHRLLSSRFLVDCQLPLDLPHRLLSSRFVWPCLPISESHDAFPAPTDAFPAPTISHSRALVCLACCAFLCQPLSLTLVESYRTIIE